jgi:large subunit ribosomal protein L15
MQIHQLRPIHVGKNKKRRGRGGKRGTYSGKGGKGQTARSGFRREPIIRELIKRYPKLKGYRSEKIPSDVAVINLQDIETAFKDSEIVNTNTLVEKRLVRRIRGKVPMIKILGKGELKKKLIFEKCIFSKTAKEAVEKAGGEIK